MLVLCRVTYLSRQCFIWQFLFVLSIVLLTTDFHLSWWAFVAFHWWFYWFPWATLTVGQVALCISVWGPTEFILILFCLWVPSVYWDLGFLIVCRNSGLWVCHICSYCLHLNWFGVVAHSSSVALWLGSDHNSDNVASWLLWVHSVCI